MNNVKLFLFFFFFFLTPYVFASSSPFPLGHKVSQQSCSLCFFHPFFSRNVWSSNPQNPSFPSPSLVIYSLFQNKTKKIKISTRICVDHSLDFQIQDQTKTEKPTRFFFRLSVFTHGCVKINTRGAGRFSFLLASFAAFFFFVHK